MHADHACGLNRTDAFTGSLHDAFNEVEINAGWPVLDLVVPGIKLESTERELGPRSHEGVWEVALVLVEQEGALLEAFRQGQKRRAPN
jgi:hypothetical protein